MLIQSVNLGDALREAFTKAVTVKRCLCVKGVWQLWV